MNRYLRRAEERFLECSGSGCLGAQREVQRFGGAASSAKVTFGRLFVDLSVYQCMSHDLYYLQVGAFVGAASSAEGQRRSVKCRGKLAFLLTFLFTNGCEHSGQRVMGGIVFLW